jgi:hypothetical protein
LGKARFVFKQRPAARSTYRIRIVPGFEGAQERNEWVMPGDLDDRLDLEVIGLTPGTYTAHLIDYGEGKRPPVEALKIEFDVPAHGVVTVSL